MLPMARAHTQTTRYLHYRLPHTAHHTSSHTATAVTPDIGYAQWEAIHVPQGAPHQSCLMLLFVHTRRRTTP